MRCTKCGAEIADNEKFCSVCGTPVDAKAKSVNDDTLSDYKVDKKDGSEKQNSNKNVKVDADTYTGSDTTDTQSDVIVSDVTVEEFTMPDYTINDDTLTDDKKFKAKDPDEISGVKEKKKSKEKEPKEEKPPKEPKEKKAKKDDKVDAKSDGKEDVADKEDKVKSDKKSEKNKDKEAKADDKKVADDKKEEAKADEKVEDKKDDKEESDKKVEDDKKAEEPKFEPISDEKVTEVTISKEDKLIKLDNDSKDIQLTVTKTTTVSEQLVNSNDTIDDYEIKMPKDEEKKISVAGKNLTFVQGGHFPLAREDKLLSPGARANIERRKAEAAEALKKGKSDEERINEAVKAIKESVIRNGKEGWICRVCGHYNPSTTTSCLKCGRDRVRMAKLKARGYDPNAVPKLVQRKKRVRPKKERIVYIGGEQKEVETGAPVVHNFIYTGGQQVLLKDQYVTVEHPIRNRILAAICTLLMLLFIFVSLFATSYISTDGSVVKGFTGIEIISSVIVSIFGGTKTGSKYFDMFSKEVTTNGWVFAEAGFLNQRTFAGLFVTLLLLAVVGIAIADLIRCIIRIAKGKALNGRFHILSMLILVGVCFMFFFIWIHNTFAFYKEGASAFWGHEANVTVTLEGMTITDVVYATGIAYILTFFFILARFIIGFFFAPAKRMTLSEACEKYPNQYPKKYQEQAAMSPEEYELIMRNAGVQAMPAESVTTVKKTTTTETITNFDTPVTFAPPPPVPVKTETTTTTTTTSTSPVVTVAAPAPTPVVAVTTTAPAPAPAPTVKTEAPIPPPDDDKKTQTFTTYTIEKSEKPVVSEYTVTTVKKTDSTIDNTQDLDNGRENSKKEGK